MKKVLSFVVLFVLCSTAAPAEEQKGSALMDWIRGIEKKISQIKPRQAVPVTTGVAGVRGAKEDAQVKLYWKGKKGDEAVTEEEMGQFKKAVELAGSDRAAAVKELESFMKQYPDSALIPDAKKTLDLVKAEPEEKVAPTTEQKPDEKKEGPKAEGTGEKKEERK